MSLRDFIYGVEGVPGDYSYGTAHLVSVLILLALCVIFGIVGASKKVSPSAKRKVALGLAWFQLGFEILWRILFLAVGKQLYTLYPFYSCNLYGILLPIACIINNKVMKNIFYVFGFIGGVLTFAMPQGIFCNAVIAFPIIKSVVQHFGLILIPLFEYISGGFRQKLKDIWLIYVGCLISIFNGEVMGILLGRPGDYLYMRSDIPFVIPGVPQFITLSVFGALVIFLITMALDPKGTKVMFQKIFHKKATATVVDKQSSNSTENIKSQDDNAKSKIKKPSTKKEK